MNLRVPMIMAHHIYNDNVPLQYEKLGHSCLNLGEGTL